MAKRLRAHSWLIKRHKDLSGKVFGYVTALFPVGFTTQHRLKWLCRCKCGGMCVRSCAQLKNNRASIVSCGCKAHEMRGGKKYSKSYSVWRSMWQRIRDHNCKKYARYGGRGINICDRWKKFENFQLDMGEKPDGMSLDRINNDGDYCPDNCRWATTRMQTRNYGRNVKITFLGRTKCLADWAEELQMPYQRLWERIRIYNWPIKDAFFQPKTIHHARRPGGHVSTKIIHP